MTAKTKNHVMAMLMRDADERSTCLRVLEREGIRSSREMHEIDAVIRRVRAALRQTESALDDLEGEEVDEGGDTE